MLAELILHATAWSSRPLRRLGLVGDAVALWSRATRRRRDWAEHERRCHAVVTEAVDRLGSRRKVLVLGSGLLRDVPLRLLRERFTQVVLLDAVHLLPAQLAARHRDVTAVVGDLTGLADMMAGAPGPRRDPLARWRADPELDLVVSANVLSQLAMAPAAWLERRPAVSGLPPDLPARIVGWHLHDLRALGCPVCLLTDVSYRERRRDGTEGPAIDLLHGHDLSRPRATWDWEVAPRGEVARDVAHVHRVHAWPNWREETWGPGIITSRPMSTIVRFAPSPTGLIHIGNARTALLNALVARREGGRFILRFDDTDRERSRREFADQTEADLGWLGIAPDLVVRQSDRMELYAEAAERLKQAGRLYPCYETQEELERRRRLQLARGLPPVYDRAALALSDAERGRLAGEGRRPHWRFRLDDVEVAWDDLVRGPSHVACASLSDPVLVREDGSYLYTLPSVVDDIDLGVTQVIRGEDHVTNTGVQIQLFEALGGHAPAFGHHNLLTSASGEGLSKRLGALSLKSLREGGLEPMAVASLAVLVGSAESVRAVSGLDELAGLVDLAHISRAPAKFDEAELDALNAKLLHDLPYGGVAARLKAAGIGGGTAFWEAVRGNLTRWSDAAAWWPVVDGPVVPVIEDHGFLGQAAALLPDGPYDGGTWRAWTALVKDRTGRKGRALFMPLRLALTGLDHGPELAALLPLIGPERARARLSGRTA